MKGYLLIAIFSFNILNAIAQSDSIGTFKMEGYVEAYYSYDFGNPDAHEKPAFYYNFNRHNEFNLNLGLIKASYSQKNVRANLGLMAGTYSQYNLSGEMPVFRHIYEANVGFRLIKNKSIWLDAGVMPSHIGAESAIGKDCWNLTRSIIAENSPYYLTGIKISGTNKNEKLSYAVLVINGWQRIQRPIGNQTPAFGTQLNYKAGSKLQLNWSTFIGNDKPDSVKQMRYFNNFYAVINITSKLGLVVDFEYGFEQKSKKSSAYNTWYSPTFVARYLVNDKWRVNARYEYFNDLNNVIISTGSVKGFNTSGYSAGIDFLPYTNIMLRIEGKYLSSANSIFIRDNKPTSENYAITVSLAAWF